MNAADFTGLLLRTIDISMAAERKRAMMELAKLKGQVARLELALAEKSPAPKSSEFLEAVQVRRTQEQLDAVAEAERATRKPPASLGARCIIEGCWGHQHTGELCLKHDRALKRGLSAP